MSRTYKTGDASSVAEALDHLKNARNLLENAGARKTLVRVRLAISSAKGALRHAENMMFRSEK